MLSKTAQSTRSVHDIDFTAADPQRAVTYELCAGIIDKVHLSAKEHAQIELLEECGYAVDMDSIESVANYCDGIGVAGASQSLFYVEVTDEMKKNDGGGNVSEQESESLSCLVNILRGKDRLRSSDCRRRNSRQSGVCNSLR
jgi:Mg-chelatase subunit ChlI